MEPFYAWIDLETTGLDPVRDCILEVALVVTNRELTERLATLEALVFPTIGLSSPPISPYVWKMHNDNGLFKVCVVGRQVAEVEAQLVAVLTEIAPGKKLHLAGSSVHFDRSFLKVWMPKVVDQLHYRQLDVSSLKLVFDPIVPCPKGEPAHRALADINESIREARWYMGNLTVASELGR